MCFLRLEREVNKSQQGTEFKTPSEKVSEMASRNFHLNPLRPNSDLSQTSHCNIKGLSGSEVMRIESVITQVKFY